MTDCYQEIVFSTEVNQGWYTKQGSVKIYQPYYTVTRDTLAEDKAIMALNDYGESSTSSK